MKPFRNIDSLDLRVYKHQKEDIRKVQESLPQNATAIGEPIYINGR